MGLLSAIKASAIKFTDVVNRLNDPFQDFTRAAMPHGSDTLAQKARIFETDLLENFLIRGRTIASYRIPQPPGSPLDLGDQSLWHGIYTAVFAFKFSITKSTDDANVLSFFHLGLRDQQPNGRLVRGIDEAGNVQTDASNDQATGHLAGLYWGWRYGPDWLKARFVDLMDQWANRILVEGHRMKNPDGSATTYGQLIQGWKTDPLRLTLCLAIYGAAHEMTQDNRYAVAYDHLMHDYGPLVAFPKVRLWWIDTVYDTHRAAIHLAILAQVHQELSAAKLGLCRIRDMVAKQGNIWVNALCALGGGVIRDDDAALANKVLSEFEYLNKRYNTGVDNTDLPFVNLCGGKTIWNGEYVSRQPLPRWTCAAQDFFWQRNLYSLAFRRTGDPADSLYNGGDFLAAYWLSRVTGILK